MQQNDRELRVLLHNIRSAHNVGSIFRTSDAIGATHVYISGYTPLPIDKFKRPRKDIAKTALGAELTIPWTQFADAEEVIAKAKNEGFTVVGLELDPRAVDYREYHTPAKVLFVVGSEVLGMSKELRDSCDVLLQISMQGKKESLNVAVAFGVALFRIWS